MKQLPYFLLFNYPQKMKTYKSIHERNKNIENKEDKLKLNAYHSPSPMNELCDYICTWEKKNILWDNSIDDLIDTRCLIVNNDLDLSDKKTIRICRKYINDYATSLKRHFSLNQNKESCNFDFEIIVDDFKERIKRELKVDENIIANYVIKTSYDSMSISKSLAWAGYGDYIIENLKNNTNPKRNISIKEVPYNTNNSYEYLGKYYEFEVGDKDIQM